MKTFQKLLVPLDGSSLAEAVLPATELLAERLAATVALLHVLEESAPETVHGQPHLADVREAEAYLQRVAERWGGRSIHVETHVHPNLERDVVGSIIGHASEFGADLIILATHGRGGMRDLLVGSIAQQVLRRGAVPVLLVKPTADGEAPEFKGEKLLVPLDGTHEHDGAVLPAVETLAERLPAALHLLVVVPTVGTVPGDQAAVAILTPNAMAAALDMEEEEARSYLQGIAERLRSRGLAVEHEVRRGAAAPIVAEVAAQSAADLLAISTHGRAGLDALWSASVGSQILARIHQPLLLVRIPD